jgi:hypothetical protein
MKMGPDRWNVQKIYFLWKIQQLDHLKRSHSREKQENITGYRKIDTELENPRGFVFVDFFTIANNANFTLVTEVGESWILRKTNEKVKPK